MARHVRSVLTRDMRKWGEFVTMDNIICKNWFKHRSGGNHSDCFTFFDFATQEIWAMGVNSLESIDTVAAIRQICRRKSIAME